MSKTFNKKPGPDATDIHVGKRVKQARNALGMSREKLAEQVGVTFQQVGKYENGENRMSCGRIAQISEVLGKRIEWFFPEKYQ